MTKLTDFQISITNEFKLNRIITDYYGLSDFNIKQLINPETGILDFLTDLFDKHENLINCKFKYDIAKITNKFDFEFLFKSDSEKVLVTSQILNKINVIKENPNLSEIDFKEIRKLIISHYKDEILKGFNEYTTNKIRLLNPFGNSNISSFNCETHFRDILNVKYEITQWPKNLYVTIKNRTHMTTKQEPKLEITIINCRQINALSLSNSLSQ